MANRNERNRADGREREKDDTGRNEGSHDSEAIPDRDPDTAYDSSTSGGATGEIEDRSETPSAAQRGRDLDH